VTVWVVRGGREGEREELCLEKSLIIIGWKEVRLDLSTIETQAELRERLQQTYPPETKPDRLSNHAGQVFRFVKTIQRGDYVVMPRKGRKTAAVGLVTGPYEYRPDLGPDNIHVRPVNWLRDEVSRNSLPAAVTYTMEGAAGTVTRVKAGDAHPSMERFVSESVTGSPSTPPVHLLLRWRLEENPQRFFSTRKSLTSTVPSGGGSLESRQVGER